MSCATVWPFLFDPNAASDPEQVLGQFGLENGVLNWGLSDVGACTRVVKCCRGGNRWAHTLGPRKRSNYAGRGWPGPPNTPVSSFFFFLFFFFLFLSFFFPSPLRLVSTPTCPQPEVCAAATQPWLPQLAATGVHRAGWALSEPGPEKFKFGSGSGKKKPDIAWQARTRAVLNAQGKRRTSLCDAQESHHAEPAACEHHPETKPRSPHKPVVAHPLDARPMAGPL